MKNKSFPSFFRFLFIALLVCIFSGVIFSQNNFIGSRVVLNIYDSDGSKTLNPIRPRVVTITENEKPENKSVKEKTIFSFEHQVFELINKKRADNSLQPLIWNDDVARIARMHSENMANYKFFSHAGIDGKMVNNRADDFGISKSRAIGENIAYNRGFTDPLEFAVESWMKSPGHRENILNNRWQESGIGIAVTADGTYYFTEVFLLRK